MRTRGVCRPFVHAHTRTAANSSYISTRKTLSLTCRRGVGHGFFFVAPSSDVQTHCAVRKRVMRKREYDRRLLSVGRALAAHSMGTPCMRWRQTPETRASDFVWLPIASEAA